MTPTEELRQQLETILNEAFNKVQSGSSWTMLGGDPPDMTEYLDTILALLDRVRVEARMEELRELMTTRWPESKNYLEKRIATLTGEEQPHE